MLCCIDGDDDDGNGYNTATSNNDSIAKSTMMGIEIKRNELEMQ